MKHLAFFFLKSILLFFFTYLILLAGANWFPAYFLYEHQILIVSFFFITGIIAHITVSLLGQKPERFTLVYLAASTIKLLLSLSIVAYVSVKLRETALQFAVNFLTAYFLFTIFEIAQYLKFLNPKQSTN